MLLPSAKGGARTYRGKRIVACCCRLWRVAAMWENMMSPQGAASGTRLPDCPVPALLPVIVWRCPIPGYE